jgi:glycosyltransferase involved in cell wall biosynthesis
MAICISVVVPTRDRADLLDRCLAALVAMDFDPQQYEVIVVDDGPGPATQRTVQRWAQGARTRIRYLTTAGARGPATARNCGWHAAAGTIVAFTDDDCLPDRGWLKAGLAAMTGDVGGVTGRMIMPLPTTPTDYQRDAARLCESDFVTANCFVRRSVLADVGGFDERFAMAWREDSDLQFSLLAHGVRLARADDAVVVHPVRPAAWGVSLRQQRRAAFNALLYKKYPQLYREHIQRSPPWRYYATTGSLVIILAGAAGGTLAVAWVAGAFWLLQTAAFCARRLRDTSRAWSHLMEMAITSALIPPLAVFWRLCGAIKYRVFFL